MKVVVAIDSLKGSLVKMLFALQSQCFQRIQGPQMMKSEGLEILLFASRFPKSGGRELPQPLCCSLPVKLPREFCHLHPQHQGRYLKDRDLYLHPLSFSGVMVEANTVEILIEYNLSGKDGSDEPGREHRKGQGRRVCPLESI